MKPLGYLFAIIAVICGVAAFTGYPHQILGAAIAGWMAFTILNEENEEDEKP